MISWDTCKQDFEWDGSLRDVYISPATLDDWNTVYAEVLDQTDARYTEDSVTKAPPSSVEAIFLHRKSVAALLLAGIGHATLAFHFFDDSEIECDLDPREIDSQDALNELMAFMQRIGDATGKVTKLTPESLRENPIISYEPEAKQFQYHTGAGQSELSSTNRP